jgi:hypothetical protein
MMFRTSRPAAVRVSSESATLTSESFIDEPLWAYSAGMKLRLAFSVAIHCDPDVLNKSRRSPGFAGVAVGV